MLRDAPDGRFVRSLRWVYVLGALPIIFPAGSSEVFEGESFFSEIFAYLPNANTAVLYFSALLFTAMSRPPVPRDVTKSELIIGGLADSRAG